MANIYVVKPNGALLFFKYQGAGEQDPSGSNFAPNSGNQIGNGWEGNLQVFGGADGVIYVVKPNGALLFFKYQGAGEQDPSGSNFAPNSGNQIGNGWEGNLQVFGGADGVIYVVKPNGALLFFKYQGAGEQDPSGSNFAPNSGNQIGNGWEGNLQVFGGVDGVIYVVKPNGALLFFKYQGAGEQDPSGSNFAPNSGNQIGNGWEGNLQVFGGF